MELSAVDLHESSLVVWMLVTQGGAVKEWYQTQEGQGKRTLRAHGRRSRGGKRMNVLITGWSMPDALVFRRGFTVRLAIKSGAILRVAG